MTNRRRFLQLLGVGTASAPLAAKEIMDEQVGSLAGIGRGEHLTTGLPGGHPSYGNEIETDIKARSFFSRFGLPAHEDEAIRKRASWVEALDPDLAAKRSWSMVIKIQEQRQRNYKRYLKEYETRGLYEEAREAFKKKHGWSWPW